MTAENKTWTALYLLEASVDYQVLKLQAYKTSWIFLKDPESNIYYTVSKLSL